MIERLINELVEVFGSEGFNRDLATEVVNYLDDEGFIDYDILKEIYGDVREKKSNYL